MPSLLRQCEACRGRFAPQYFRNSSACRLCHLNSKVERLNEKYEEKCKQYEDVVQQLEALKEFVVSNTGCTSTDVVPAIPDRPASSTLGAPARPHAELAESPFILVKNRATTTNVKNFLPISTHNRYQILAEEEEDAQETRLVGDSIVRGQLSEFCGRARRTRKRLCMPGGRLDDITAACDEAACGSNNNTLFIIHAGTNDVENTRSEELMEKFKKMIQRFKTKSNNIIVSGCCLTAGKDVMRP
ncbi:uncharacterized protein LOC135098765 [Scylla paramamosain]|uniref:uncharacterized protein LOC135098765 n=1 Tax=Scylla paramamosain TaxID=85552 RepID=UPI003083425B